MTDAPPGEPSADPRDALIREQAQLIAVQAERIAVLEAAVAGSGAPGDGGARGIAEQRELLDAAGLG